MNEKKNQPKSNNILFVAAVLTTVASKVMCRIDPHFLPKNKQTIQWNQKGREEKREKKNLQVWIAA